MLKITGGKNAGTLRQHRGKAHRLGLLKTMQTVGSNGICLKKGAFKFGDHSGQRGIIRGKRNVFNKTREKKNVYEKRRSYLEKSLWEGSCGHVERKSVS